MNDLKFALRQLRKSPGFTFLAVLTLALGIGMNTAIFSLIQDLFLRGLPFSEPQRVVRIYGESKERDLKQMPSSVPKFWHYRDGQTVFSSIAADWGNGFIMTGSGEPVQLLGGNVTANYFELLGIHPILGRNFLPEEESKGDVVMVTESFWRKYFNSDPAILGRSITLNGVPNTIIGVLPNLPISWFGRDSEIFANKPFEPSGITKDRLMRGVSFMRVTARLKPGISISQAQAAMPTLFQSYKEQHPETADNTWSPYLVSAAEDVTGDLRPAFLTLLAAVSAVLLIACSNVANLLLVRFTGRKREIALRMALGAERHGIVRLFVFESTLVSVIAGVIGLFLALWTVSIVPKLAGQNVPLESEIKSAMAGAHFHTWTIAHHGSSHGSLSGVAEFARRSRRWTQGGRTRSEWQSRSTSFPSRFGHGASWIIGRAGGRSRHADFQFCPAQSAGSGVPVGPSVGGRNWSSARAISRSRDTRTLRGTIAGGIADCSRRGGRHDHGCSPTLWKSFVVAVCTSRWKSCAGESAAARSHAQRFAWIFSNARDSAPFGSRFHRTR